MVISSLIYANEIIMKNGSTTLLPAPLAPPQTLNDLGHDLECCALLTPAERDAITPEIPIKTCQKGTFLLREGQVVTTCYSIIRGCVREYFLMDGEERTTEFYTEGDSLSAAPSRIQGTPARQYWECLETTTLTVLTHEKEKDFYRRFPRLESLCRIEMEQKFAAYQAAMALYINSTPEERYLNLLKTRPDLLDRVPQYQLASYIGVKPESLSRIRGRIRAVGRQQSKAPPPLNSKVYHSATPPM